MFKNFYLMGVIAVSAGLAPALALAGSDDPAPPQGCLSVSEHGTEIKINGQSPLGEGVVLVAYSNGISVQSPLTNEARGFLLTHREEPSGWFHMKSVLRWQTNKGNLTKQDSAPRYGDSNPDKIINKKIQVQYKGDTLIIQRTDLDPPLTVKVTSHHPDFVKDPQSKKFVPVDMTNPDSYFNTTVSVLDASGKEVGSYYGAFPPSDFSDIQAAIAQDESKTGRSIDARSLKKPAEKVDFASSPSWTRRACDKPTSLSGSGLATNAQGAGDSSAPTQPN